MTQQPQTTAIASPVSSPNIGPTPAIRPVQILLIDDDDEFRESLGLNLMDEGFSVSTFSGGVSALGFLAANPAPDVILLDWRMPGMNGLEVLREIRLRGIMSPVIFLTALSDDIYEEAALAGGAVDFIDKSRRLSILVRRIELITEGARTAAERVQQQQPDVIRLGPLELRFDINRAMWNSETVDLTLSEFRIVAQLAVKPGEDVSYREIYDLVHGKDFIAGSGAEGFRANVRTFIKRIRKKFRDVDSNFDQIHNYAGFGYRWSVA